MCMLYVKPENFTMPVNYLESLKRKNPDGLAIYNKTTGEVFKTLNYATGFKYFEDNHANELVVHFRFGTSGENTESQLHGFNICKNQYILFHNGVLSSIDANEPDGLSDTQVLVNIFRDEPVEALVSYLEKYEKGSRFLIVNKETKEYIIPKCAVWSGDATINGTHIMFSNSYAIDYKLLDYGFSGKSNYTTNVVNWRDYDSTSGYSRKSQDYYDSMMNYDLDEFESEEEEDSEYKSKLNLELFELIWRGNRKEAIAFIKENPYIAHDYIVGLLEETTTLPF